MRKTVSYRMGNLKGLSYKDCLKIINEITKKTFEYTKQNGHDENNRTTPMDFGNLRQSIHNAIDDKSKNESWGIEINISSDLPYAKYVDKMSTAQVAHSIDPDAIGGFAKHLAKYLKERLRLNWKDSKKQICGI